MKPDGLRINVSTRPGTFIDDVYIYAEAPNDKVAVYGLENGQAFTKLYDRGDADIPPTFSADHRVVVAIVAAFAENAKKLGIPEPTKEYANGKLEATEKHLEDMRKLVFK